MVIDIKRAHFYAPSQRDIYVRLPPEDPRSGDPSVCGRLKKSLYGTRDAGANWQAAYTEFLLSIDMLQGTTNPCHFFSGDHSLKGIVHGDDFLFTGTAAQLEWLRQKFDKEYETKTEMIGYGPNVANSARFLNRVITFGKDGVEFEPDQRLVEAIIDGLGLKGSNTVTT